MGIFFPERGIPCAVVLLHKEFQGSPELEVSAVNSSPYPEACSHGSVEALPVTIGGILPQDSFESQIEIVYCIKIFFLEVLLVITLFLFKGASVSQVEIAFHHEPEKTLEHFLIDHQEGVAAYSGMCIGDEVFFPPPDDLGVNIFKAIRIIGAPIYRYT